VLGQPIGEGIQAPPPIGVPERLQFERQDGTAVVQVGPGILVVNHLRPYPTWNDFRKLVVKICNQYEETIEKLKLKPIGIRYIDHVPLDWLTLPRDVPVMAPVERAFGLKATAFFQRFDLAHSENGGTLVHQCGTIAVSGKSTLVIDLAFYSSSVSHIEGDEDLFCRLDGAHDVVERAFANSMSNDLYERLRGGGTCRTRLLGETGPPNIGRADGTVRNKTRSFIPFRGSDDPARACTRAA
jgi:uncharacterized protein (TIGR04255 family)